jgi:hypothetical protein
MTKTDQLINALSERFRTTYKDCTYINVDSLVLGYFRGFLEVLEGSDDKLAAALDYHLHDTLEYNNEQSRLQEVA